MRESIEAGAPTARSVNVTDEFAGTGPWAISADGTQAFFQIVHGVVQYNLRTGEHEEEIRAGVSQHELAMDVPRSRLFVSLFGGTIRIRDFAHDRWLARLRYPQPFIAPRLSVSPDGRWLAATPFRSAGAGGPFTPRAVPL